MDLTVKQNARANTKMLVKRILRKYGYPPDLQEAATETVLEQAELLAAGWAVQPCHSSLKPERLKRLSK